MGTTNKIPIVAKNDNWKPISKRRDMGFDQIIAVAARIKAFLESYNLPEFWANKTKSPITAALITEAEAPVKIANIKIAPTENQKEILRLKNNNKSHETTVAIIVIL